MIGNDFICKMTPLTGVESKVNLTPERFYDDIQVPLVSQ